MGEGCPGGELPPTPDWGPPIGPSDLPAPGPPTSCHLCGRLPAYRRGSPGTLGCRALGAERSHPGTPGGWDGAFQGVGGWGAFPLQERKKGKQGDWAEKAKKKKKERNRKKKKGGSRTKFGGFLSEGKVELPRMVLWKRGVCAEQ